MCSKFFFFLNIFQWSHKNVSFPFFKFFKLILSIKHFFIKYQRIWNKYKFHFFFRKWIGFKWWIEWIELNWWMMNRSWWIEVVRTCLAPEFLFICLSFSLFISNLLAYWKYEPIFRISSITIFFFLIFNSFIWFMIDYLLLLFDLFFNSYLIQFWII